MFRQFFIVFRARPDGGLLGWPGEVMGAFNLWRRNRAAREGVLPQYGILPPDVRYFGERVSTGDRVALAGVVRLAVDHGRTILWGSLLNGSWARRVIFAVDITPDHLLHGKLLIDGAISLFCKER